jgi:hypothetical protein
LVPYKLGNLDESLLRFITQQEGSYTSASALKNDMARKSTSLEDSETLTF